MNSKPPQNWVSSVGVKSCIAAGNLKEKAGFRSVRFQTWLYFFLLAGLVLLVLWSLQLLFFKAAFRNMKKQEVERLGEEIAQKYPGRAGSKEYGNFLKQTADYNGLNIIIFHTAEAYEACPVSEVAFAVEYISGLADKDLIIADDVSIIEEWDKFYPAVKADGVVEYTRYVERNPYFVYGARLDEKGVFLYMETPMRVYDSTMAVMNNQLFFSSVVCLILSIVVSYFISNRITKPITEFSRVARKLGAGDYSVRFKGNGYAEIENLADTLNYATEEIGKTEQLRRDFLANVSHDLRTPLTMVKAYAEMIRDLSGNDEIKRAQHSQVIIDEADRLTGLVGDILNLSKLQSGTAPIEKGDVDMRVLAKNVVERFDLYATRDGYVFDLTAEGNTTAYGDMRRLEQVLYNLVGNAINYTGENKTVQIQVCGCDGTVRVGVRDFGAGIAPEEIDKVWDRYYRSNQHKRTVVGSGLGLSIVKSILVAHDARFGVNSALGEGTEFWFELSRGQQAAPVEKEKPTVKKRSRKKTNKTETSEGEISNR